MEKSMIPMNFVSLDSFYHRKLWLGEAILLYVCTWFKGNCLHIIFCTWTGSKRSTFVASILDGNSSVYCEIVKSVGWSNYIKLTQSWLLHNLIEKPDKILLWVSKYVTVLTEQVAVLATSHSQVVYNNPNHETHTSFIDWLYSYIGHVETSCLEIINGDVWFITFVLYNYTYVTLSKVVACILVLLTETSKPMLYKITVIHNQF